MSINEINHSIQTQSDCNKNCFSQIKQETNENQIKQNKQTEISQNLNQINETINSLKEENKNN